MRRTSIALLLALLLTSLLLASVNIREAKASGTVYIRTDGSIDPPAANITTTDNVTYTFTGNNYASIVVQRDDIVIDGAGYTLQGTGSGRGIDLTGRTGVTVQSTQIIDFYYGIRLSSSSHNSILRNTMTTNSTNYPYGIWLDNHSDNNNISDNNITDNWHHGIVLERSLSNSISGNTITANKWFGIYLNYWSSGNSVSGNSIAANNGYGIAVFASDRNSIVGNSITTNTRWGIWLRISGYTTISGNCIADNGRGIMFESSGSSTISGNNVTANSGDGIALASDSRFNTVSGNNVTANSGDGITASGSRASRILGNTVMANSGAGIAVSSSSASTISGNSVAANNPGILIESSSNYCTVSDNTFTDDGLRVTSSYENSVENNTVNGRPLVYLEDVSSSTVEAAGQVILVRCANITVKDLDLSRTSVGIELWETDNSTVSGNNVTANSRDGLWLTGSSGNTISENYIVDNHYGLRLEASSNLNTISNNIIANNDDGVGLLSGSSANDISANNITTNTYGIWFFSSDNRIVHNNFINNSHPLYTSTAMSLWDDGYPSGGNYWSDYTVEDTYCGPQQNLPGSDGLGDVPRVFNSSNQDHYPLMAPWSWASHNIAVSAIFSRDVVGHGYTTQVNVTVTNHGAYIETFNVTLHTNTTLLGTQNVVLSGDHSTILTYIWNTTGLPRGYYALRVYAESVPGEENTVDNTFVYGWVTVMQLPGDVDWDYDVDIFDIVHMGSVYGVEQPDSRYDPRCDLDGDGDIDLSDLVIAASHYGDSW